ncbi:MAG: radical SAM protein [Lachnospiraceae bacterium]|nr:radical SAM protein [Lachnospiraceae bacterium]
MKKLEYVSLDVTYRCNYRCLHCFNSSGNEKKYLQELSEDEMLRIAADFAAYNPSSFCICGGEPLLKKELLYKLSEKIKQISPSTSVNLVTNGYYMTEEIADNLKQSKFDLVQVSLDGVSNETHNWLRGNDQALERAINAIKIVVAKGFFTGVACAPTKKNIDQISEVLEKAYSLGVKTFRSQPLMLLGRAKKNLKEYVLDEYESFGLIELLDEAKQKYKGMDISWGDPIQHIAELRATEKEVNFACVNAGGNLILSPYLPIDFGNIKNHTLEEYLSHGYTTINRNVFVKRVLSMIDDANTLDVHEQNPRLPELGVEENIHMDVLGEESLDAQGERLLKEYFED